MDGDDDDSRAAAQRAEARGTLEKLQGQQEKSRNTAPDNSSGDLTDRETEGELHRARTVLHDLEFQEDQEEDPKARAKETPTHPLVQRAAVYSNLVTFSILGAVTRIGLTRLCTYPGQAVFATAVSQAVGCAVMGLVVRNKSLLESIDASVFIGLGTGYCGSVTTFSTWMLETFEAFANAKHYSHGGVHNVVDGLTQLFITFAVSVAGLRFGIHTSTFLHTLRGTSPQSTANVPKKHFFYGATVLIAILCWVAVLVLTILLPFYRHVTFALLFAPFGTILRFWLAKINRYDVQLPWGTLSANLIGTAILAACTAIQRRPGVTFLSCGVLQGFDDGFCGCLTTVSTFAVELRGLRRLPAYIYTAVSILTCISLVVLIYGSVWWSIGLVARCSFETARSL